MGTRASRGRHAQPSVFRQRPRLLAGLAVVVLSIAGVVAWQAGGDGHPAPRTAPDAGASAAECSHRIRAVTAASFAPVLRQVAHRLASGSGCVDVEVTEADGQGAATLVATTGADVWIPDDASWRNLPNPVAFARTGAATIATSPLYFVMGPATAATQPAAARTWTGLAAELAAHGPTRLVMRDPATSGDGLVAGGALTESVIAASGPLVSAYDLMRAWQTSTTIDRSSPALPTRFGQVGIISEYALLRSGRAARYTVVAPTDATALMRFTWYPTASGTSDPARAAALSKLYAALTDNGGQAALRQFGLRGPDWPAAPPPTADVHVPAVHAPPMSATVEHAMWHVLTTWNPQQRVANVLVVVDVSGSMGDPAPGTATPLIALVREGAIQVDALLPATARLGLWQFGSRLAPPNDYQPLVPIGLLTGPQRTRFAAATTALRARKTGTGLYNTILAAYRYQQAHFQAGLPNEILLFTDGVNEDTSSISLAQLKANLAAADPARRVQVGIFAFGKRLPTNALTDALTPVDGQVDPLTNANDVVAAFVHAVSGGLTH